MHLSKYLLGLLSVIFISCQQSDSAQETFDLLIKNAKIVDGSGDEAYEGYVFINGDEIAKITKDLNNAPQATRTIDAEGKVLAPGFIDTHTHGDPLATPEFPNFLAMGVTTIFMGQDGSSPKTTDLNSWMEEVNAVNPGVNVAMFVGHGTLRMLSGIEYDKNPTEEGLKNLEKLVAEAMEAGAFGVTTGLEYNPGYVAKKEELARVAKVVGDHDGVMMSHMRNEDDDAIEDSLDEFLSLGEHCPVHVSHIKVVYAKGEERAQEVLGILEESRKKGYTVTADLYPYEASYTSISILFPEWAKAPADYNEVVANRGNELLTYLRNRVNLRNGPEATLLGTGEYRGKTLKQVAEEKGKPFEKVLMEDIGPTGTSAAYFVMDETVMKEFLKDPYVNVCSDGSLTGNHPRGHGTFAKIIESYVSNEPILKLEEAIHKMTGLAAQNVKLEKRGLIKEGYKADLVMFDPAQIKAMATYENPAQLAKGFDLVIVNGEIAKEGKEFKNRSGIIIRK
ncbi:amidohydrolase family protein [Litoribacter alkaliphilus]|uniref:Amidohydrolase family protein n=1 Tax=Litoribacter ruber TaxID=702568 RepID=A0AAP2G557_9BACT|nr:amidohydrolase family protein [Litoribacter alkaliphilus]MBS9524751.1 amidohydrolase family protein [Litoribacter alkaliphilus]